ncbi:MAG: 2-methoxy-6-polyprenyl-1,4-benzoquinol methylase, mitochondrial [Chlamydiia bacterium]|nr:2-methoxy-6-polyprenyl-1,4-benzoquinol methylase, mitochondrial [Chlamydiia bacterium]MCH9616060.1 2-methoxy-6-polyprenyl-1,4-benzoquinol methylase, mitochondrial [Chlamydiia bacterium]MCH9629083.1 2-methoxy-6-polyprenyl-1,4-benzoquinol methylase, mitochondrial [Chlamydiia bacterium]
MGTVNAWNVGERMRGYGVDSKGIIVGFIFGAILCAVLISVTVIWVLNPLYRLILIAFFSVNALYFLVAMFYMVWSSKVGKIRLCKELVASMGLSKTDHVLDVGCGRGLYLNEVAKFARRSVGVDLSEKKLQIAQENGAGEVVQADMRSLPFENGEFDVSIIACVLYHSHDKDEQAQILREIARVTKKSVMIVDFQNLKSYVATLQAEGFEVEVGPPRYLMFPLIRVLKAERV